MRVIVACALAVAIPVPAASADPSHLLYLDSCRPNGCQVAPGPDDSRSGRSSLVEAPSTLSPWQWGDDKWQAFVQCLRDAYAPFDIEITLDDPGGATHFELMAGGWASELGEGTAAGVAPFIPCDGLHDNAISFLFANETDDVDALCWGGAQETGHVFGLDHELDASDPMTYLPPAKKSGFQDVAASCGESTARECACGGPTQNSRARLAYMLGLARPTPQYGDLGAPCASAGDCHAEMCASDGAQQLCTIPCDLAPCPDGFSCVAAGDDLNVCWPSSPPLAAEPGCSAALDPAIWAALALLLMPRRRGRRAIASTHEQPAGCAARARD